MKRAWQSPLSLMAGGLAAAFLLLSLSRSAPAEKPPTTDPYLAKLQLGVLYMQQGGQSPMTGVKLLRKVAAAYPNRFEAPLQLGSFSMTTGQYAKATGWFGKAAKAAQTSDDKVYCLINWSDALVMAEKKDSARLILKQVFNYSKDSLLLRSVNERLNALN